MRLGRRGFTLIEMLVVVAIITLLGGIVTYSLMTNVRKAKLTGTKGQLNLIEMALAQYKTDLGSYPPSEYLAKALEDGLGTSLRWHGPYLKLQSGQYGLVDGSGSLQNSKTTPLTYTDGTNAEQLLLPNRDGAKVYLDQFKRPIVYIPYYEYESGLAITDENETFYNPIGYQLFSFGEDGRAVRGKLMLFDDGIDNDGDGLSDLGATARSTIESKGIPEDDVATF